MTGFEPAIGGTTIRCLTAWLHRFDILNVEIRIPNIIFSPFVPFGTAIVAWEECKNWKKGDKTNLQDGYFLVLSMRQWLR